MATRNRYRFHEGRHLNDAGISLVAGAMREDAAGRVPAELLTHIEKCPKCKAAILSFSEILDELHDSDQQALFADTEGLPQLLPMNIIRFPDRKSLMKRIRRPRFWMKVGFLVYGIIISLVTVGVIYSIRSGTFHRDREVAENTQKINDLIDNFRFSVLPGSTRQINLTEENQPVYKKAPFNIYWQATSPDSNARLLIVDASARIVSDWLIQDSPVRIATDLKPGLYHYLLISGGAESGRGAFIVERTQPDRFP